MKIARNANFHTANVTIDRNLSLEASYRKVSNHHQKNHRNFFGPKSHFHHSIIYSSTIQSKIFHQIIKEFRSSLSASKGMLSGHAVSVRDSSELLLTNPVSELDENEVEEEEEEESPGKILYTASFEELAKSYLQYDTIIWVLISLLLVLAWGVGIIMLIYLPVRRYVLRKDISSRRLYVTPNDIVYKVSRPLFLPFLGVTKIEKRIPLRLVINIIMEQGCLQSIYGLHTFRVQSIAHGIAAPVDELQVQGVSNPECLRKVIVTEASKIKLVGRDWKKIMIEEPHDGRSASSNWKDGRGTIPAELVLHKLDEVNQSVKRIESLIGKPQAVPGSN